MKRQLERSIVIPGQKSTQSLSQSISNQSHRAFNLRKPRSRRAVASNTEMQYAGETTIVQDKIQVTNQSQDDMLEESDDDFEVSDHMLNDSVFLQRPSNIRGLSLGADQQSYHAYAADYLSQTTYKQPQRR